jgi:predicted DNA-binding transcriptional regulator AlpA
VNVTLTLSDDQVREIAERAAAIITETAPSTPEPWLTVEHAAAHLGISTSQLYTLSSQHHRNGLPVVKEGSRSYFKASELDKWRAKETS